MKFMYFTDKFSGFIFRFQFSLILFLDMCVSPDSCNFIKLFFYQKSKTIYVRVHKFFHFRMVTDITNRKIDLNGLNPMDC